MFEYIKDAHLSPFLWALKDRKYTDGIILHHVAGTMTVQAIHEMHKDETDHGYPGIAYNIYIDKDGTCYWGRGLMAQGGATRTTLGLNTHIIHVVCNGDFMKEQMSAAQRAALVRVVSDLVTYFKFTSVNQIKGHREVDDTDCPGINFPLDELREYIRNPGQMATPIVASVTTFHVDHDLRQNPKNDPLHIDEQLKPVQQKLHDLGYYNGIIDGIFGPRTNDAVETFQIRNKLIKDGVVGKNTTTKLGGVWDGDK